LTEPLAAMLACLCLTAGAFAEGKPKTEIVPQIAHLHSVNAVAFSPDGARVLSGSDDKTIKLWDVATGALLRTFAGHSDRVTSVAFSPDGTHVLSGSWDGTKLWDVATGALLRSFQGHTGAVTSVAFSPDGTRVLSGSAGNNDKTLKLWDAATGALLRTFEGHSTGVTSVAFSPDGTRVLSGSYDKTLKVWDAATGALLRTFEGHTEWVTSVAFSPDGTRALSGSADKTLKLWNVATGASLRTIQGHSDRINSVAFSHDGTHVLSGSGSLADKENTLKLWEAATGALLRAFEGRSTAVNAVAFSHHGTHVLSGSSDGTKLWDAATGALLRTFQGHTGKITSVAFSPDGTRVLSGSWAKLTMWDAATGVLLHTFEGHTEWVTSIAFSRDGTRVLSGGRDGAKLWDAVTGALLRTFQGHSTAVNSVAFSPDGTRVLSGGEFATTEMWDAATGQLLQTFKVAGDVWEVWSVAFSPDGARVLSGGRDGAKLWDAANGALLRTFEGSSTEINSVAFSPDGTHVLLSGSNTIKLWDAATGTLLRTFAGHSGYVSSATFSPDDGRLLSGSRDTTVRIWDTQTGDLLATLIASRDREWIALTPEGFFAVSPHGENLLSIVRGVDRTSIGQVHQSLYNPDLVREALAGDPDGDVKRASEVINLDKVIDSGPAPLVEITSPTHASTSETDIATVAAHISDRGSGIGRIEWRVNGITVAVSNAPQNTGARYDVTQHLALDPGNNTVEVLAYNKRNLLASLPADTTLTFKGAVDTIKPTLHVLAIGINKYVDKGWVSPNGGSSYFPPLGLAVSDATALADRLQKAGAGLYREVRATKVLDEEATAANLDAIVTKMASDISPRDTFVFFAAAHGYSNNGRFFLIPQDYQGGASPEALAKRAIGQLQLQDWIANRIKAKKALILLDTCESGALTNGYEHSRVDGPAAEAGIGRLHEATGRPVLTASAANQFAHEGPIGGSNERHGVFTWAVLDALRNGDTNGDGVIELSELVSHVQSVVPNLAYDIAHKKQARAVTQAGPVFGVQTPRFGSPSEDFALVQRLH
jgi:WD40 repeat protein